MREVTRENEELKAKVEIERKLEVMLTEKRQNEQELNRMNETRIERFNERLNSLYFYYDKHLHNKKQELKGNIRVFCRVRPILNEDLSIIQSRLSMKPSMLPVAMPNFGIKSKKRMEELKINFNKDRKVSNPSSPARNMLTKLIALPEVEDTITFKGDHTLELKYNNQYFGNGGQF